MIQLKIQDQAGSIEVQDQTGPIQFRSLAQNRTGLTISTSRAIRLGFSKAVQQILDQDVQSGQEELLIEEMIQLKIQDQAGSIEVQDQTGPIQFRSLAQNRTGLTISTCDLGSKPCPNPSRFWVIHHIPFKVQTGRSSLHRIRLAAPLSIRSSCPIRSLEPQSSHLSSLDPSLQHLVSEPQAPK
ncbi:hypothetical protein F2Q68_00017063 [Brassica cretica]|uniref:Uncharacterized protein n=1 Tax=Brassica cretica TaxID=69181 RepID=A0A8S9HJJ3_BRACR|nr:hypothetical protein F2Q68_00017063 [Brassica cretica]